MTVRSGIFASGAALNAWEFGIALLPSGGAALVRSAVLLGTTIRAIVGAIGALGGSATVRVRALQRIVDDPASWPVVIGATPVRAVERANRAELAALVVAVAAAEAVSAATAIRFASHDEAVALRDALADDLDRLALTAADAGDDAQAMLLDTLRRTMVRDVTDRGAALVRLYSFTPRTTEPALVIAHRLYGAVDVDGSAAELVARNRVRHPGFVPGGLPLEVRSAA